MKKLLSILLLGAAAGMQAGASTVKQWDFNSVTFDSPGVGTLRPGNGIGFPAEPAGGVGNQFGQVSVATGSSDPNTLDNSHWRLGSIAGLGGFPVATNANKTAGASFRVNTSGYTNIHLMWDQENSATAARYWRIQYTTNAGTTWLDATNVIVANPIGNPNPDTDTPTWQLSLTADLSALTDLNNNTNAGIRFVSEFEFTATGAGTNAYIANRTNSTYGINGTAWFDMVTVIGDDMDTGNQWPTLTAINDLIVLTNQSTGPLAFTVADTETAADNLGLTVVSTVPSLVSSMTFGGSGNDRTLTVVPGSQPGTAVISVRARDEGGKVTESSFRLTVVGTPTLSRIFPQTTSWDVPLTNAFTVFNLVGDPTTWVLTASSSNTNIVANTGIAFFGTDSNRTVTITPQTNALGDTTISITASNSGYSASTNFLVRLAPPYVVQWDMLVVTSNTAMATLPPTSVATGLAVSDLGRGPGLAAFGLTSGYSANRWNNSASTYLPSTPSRANAISRGDYYEFTVTVQAGSAISLATLDASLRRSALNAALNFEWQYSLDGFATAGITIPPRGPIWTVLGLGTGNTFTYQGRTTGATPATLELYDWVLKDVPGRTDTTTTPGDAIPTIDLSGIAQLRSVVGPKTITFRLYGWGNASTADSNTTALGRVNGPRLRASIVPNLAIALAGGNVQLSWPTNMAGFSLQSTTNLAPSNWQATTPPSILGDQNVVSVPVSGNQFFRLIK